MVFCCVKGQGTASLSIQMRRSCASFFSSAYDTPFLTKIAILLPARLPATLPSTTSITKLSCYKMCPSHLIFLVRIIYSRVLVSLTLIKMSSLVILSSWVVPSIFLDTHISNASNFFCSAFHLMDSALGFESEGPYDSWFGVQLCLSHTSSAGSDCGN